MAIHAYPISPALGEEGFDSWQPQTQYEKWQQLAEVGVEAILSDFPKDTIKFFSK